MSTDHEAVIKRLLTSLNESNYDEYEKLLTEDYVEEYPQSGEVIRGPKNSRAIREQYPGGALQDRIETASSRVAATEARWLRTPTFTVVRAEGTGNVGFSAMQSRYPDGSTWWVINFYELRGGRLARSTTYFAPLFEPPEWRKLYVEQRGPTADR